MAYRLHHSRLTLMIAALNSVLHSYVYQYQSPGDMILILKNIPVHAGAFTDVIQQIHIQEQGNVIPYSVAPEHIDVKSREIPDLDHGQRAQNIRQDDLRLQDIAFHVIKQRIVPADHVNKDQIIDELDVFDFLFFRFQKIHEAIIIHFV